MKIQKFLIGISVAVLVLIPVFESSAMQVGGEIITVTTDEDVTDFGGDQMVADLPGIDGQVSFHEAVIAANNTPGPQEIHFEIPQSDWDYDPDQATIKLVNGPFVITSDEVTIDFTTQTDFTGDTNPDGNEVSIVGMQNNGSGSPAIYLDGDNNSVIGLDRVTNRGYAISIRGNGNRVLGCTITGPLFAAVEINGSGEVPATGNVIGGTEPGEGNILAAGNAGVRIDAPADNNVVIGNLLGGSVSGVQVRGAPSVNLFPNDNRIGGTTEAERNVIGGSGYTREHGVAVGDLVRIEYAIGTIVEGNYIGTEEDGFTADHQIAPVGVELTGCDDTIVRNNLIAGINGSGILLIGETNNTKVFGNLIGTDKTGINPLPNRIGVRVSSFTSQQVPGPNFIGGLEPGQANVIAYNELAGVYLDVLAYNTRISGNSIRSNDGLGIDIIPPSGNLGVTPNDIGDADTLGGNRMQNFPVIDSTLSDGSTTLVEGTFNSSPNNDFSLEFFSNSEAHISGHGEGETFLGAVQVTTDSNGDATYSHSFSVETPVGQFVSATATNLASNDTSEFSSGSEVGSTTAPATLTGFAIASGEALGGSMRDLASSDDLYLNTRSGFGFTFLDLHNMELLIDATTNVTTPTLIDITIESHIDFAIGSGVVSLRNWKTGKFESVGSFAVTMTDQIAEVNDIDATRYVGAKGQIELAVKHRVFIPQFVFRFESFVDQIKVEVR